MIAIKILEAFELEINKIDSDFTKPMTDDSIYWLNQAVVKFVKERFNGNLPHRTSYELNEKRTRDLVNLYKEYKPVVPSPVNDVNYASYTFTNPTDLMYALNEDVIISDTNDKHQMNTCVFECTADSFMYRINNSLTDFHYKHHRARPLRIRTANGFSLLTDKNYLIQSYTLGYIKTPEEISATGGPDHDYKDFPEYVWPEIIKIAALMYIENQADPRYKTLTNEVLTQE